MADKKLKANLEIDGSLIVKASPNGQGDFLTIGNTGLIQKRTQLEITQDLNLPTPTDVANWNTSYSWGNHAGLYSLLNHTHNNLKTVNANLWNDINDILYGDNFVFTSSVSYQKANMFPSAWSTNAILSIGTYVDEGFAGTQIGVASAESSLYIRHKMFGTWGGWAKFWTSENLTQASINSWNNAAAFASNFNANNFILNQISSFQGGANFWISGGYAEWMFKAPKMQFGTPDSGQARDMQIEGNYGDYTLDFTRIQGTIALPIKVGGILISNDYGTNPPTNGLFVKGAIVNQGINADSIVYTDTNKQLVGITGAVGQLLRRSTTGFEFFTPDYLTPGSLTGYATQTWVNSQGYLSSETSQWYNNSYEFSIASPLNLGSKGIDTKGGFASNTQVLAMDSIVADDVHTVIRHNVNDDNIELEIPPAENFIDREIVITNNVSTSSSTTGLILLVGDPVRLNSTTNIESICGVSYAPFGAPFPNFWSSITIKSIKDNTTNGASWYAIDKSR